MGSFTEQISEHSGEVFLRRLDNTVMKANTDPDVFMSEIYQLRDELRDLDEVVPAKRLTTIILDTLPAEKYSTIKYQAFRDFNFSFEEIQSTMKTISINHSEKKSSVTKRGQERYRRSRYMAEIQRCPLS